MTENNKSDKTTNEKISHIRSVSIILSGAGVFLLAVSVCLYFPELPVSPLPVLGALLFLAGLAGAESSRAMAEAECERGGKKEE